MTGSEAPDAEADLAATAALLGTHLDPVRFATTDYLRWFYRENPRGPAIEEHVDQNGRRVAHYGVIPTRFRSPAGPTPFILSSNVATDPGVRRGGLFRTMADRVYPRAAATGAPAMVAVANDASTAVIVGRFGWEHHGPLPVRICAPTSRVRAVESLPADEALVDRDRFDDLARGLDDLTVRNWVQSWTPDFLRWRLRRPGGGYVLHVADDALAVSTRTRAPLRVPMAVLCKVFPRPGASLPVDAGRFVTAACRYHRAPACVYAGFHAHVRIRGARTPTRLQPSPLNVVLKRLDDTRIPPGSFRLDTFEFLDGDAF